MSGSVHILGGLELDRAGGSRVVESIKGLDDSPEIRSVFDERAQEDGLWDSPSFYGGRVMTVQGFADEGSPGAAHDLLQALRSMARLLTDLVVVSDARGTVSTQVRMQAGIAVHWMGPCAFRYMCTLVASDPYLYGPEVYGSTPLAASVTGAGLVYPLAYLLSYGAPPGPAAGSVRAGNVGTASYHPRMRVTGPVTRPVVTMVETGDWVRYDGVVAAGQHLDINWGTPRRVTLGDNAVNVRHRVSFSGNWLAVPLGGGTVTFDADDADPAAELSLWSYEGCWE